MNKKCEHNWINVGFGPSFPYTKTKYLKRIKIDYDTRNYDLICVKCGKLARSVITRKRIGDKNPRVKFVIEDD